MSKLSAVEASGPGVSLETGSQGLLGSYRLREGLDVPDYLEQTYWWAYLHPNAVRFFERQWIVNTILWGNFSRLRDLALDEIGHNANARVLQVACVYGDFSPRVAARLGEGGSLDVVDVAPVQLENVSRKVQGLNNVAVLHQDSTQLTFADASYDDVVVFFLLHEQPEAARKATIAEALRVTRPGGKVIFVDYHKPSALSPFRYIMRPILSTLEPFALDMWQREIASWIPAGITPAKVEKATFFGGLYQKVVITR